MLPSTRNSRRETISSPLVSLDSDADEDTAKESSTAASDNLAIKNVAGGEKEENSDNELKHGNSSDSDVEGDSKSSG